MSEIVPDYIEDYIRALLPADEFLEGLEAEAVRRGIPIVGPTEGYLLYLLAKMAKASSILEIGTAIGYSTIWLARAVSEKDGMVYTIERYEELAAEAVENIKKVGLGKRAKVLVGEARDLLSNMEEKFDLIFNDADKGEYPELLDLILPLLKDGGVLVTDNALWGGSVARREKHPWSEAIYEYNKRLAENPELETIIIPVRDGVSIAHKKRS
ncbi:MAG: O-methyltransferase [Candidatus Hydrothermarchaeaceae archaeon]